MRKVKSLANGNPCRDEVANADDKVLGEQCADVGPNAVAVPRQRQPHHQVAQDHAGHGTEKQRFEIHGSNQQAPRGHACPGDDEAQRDPLKHALEQGLSVMAGHKRSREVHEPKKGDAQDSAEPPSGGNVLRGQVRSLNQGRPHAQLGEQFHHANHHQSDGHDAEVIDVNPSGQQGHVHQLQDDLQEHIETLPAQRLTP